MIENTPVEGSEKVEQCLEDALKKASDDIYDALCDSFNTPAVMAIISDLISSFNSSDKAWIGSEMTRKIANLVTSIVNTFGLNGNASPEDGKVGWSGIDIPDEAKPHLSSLSKLRDNLRQKARAPGGLTAETLKEISSSAYQQRDPSESSPNSFEKVLLNFQSEILSLSDSSTLSTSVLKLCDRVRDVDLWEIGIYLEDRDGTQGALIRPVTTALRQVRLEKQERDQQKERAKMDKEREAAAKADKGRLSHFDIFKTKEYSEWDNDGMPIKDAAGEEITKNRGKKLKKEWERQKKLHEAWVEANPGAS